MLCGFGAHYLSQLSYFLPTMTTGSKKSRNHRTDLQLIQKRSQIPLKNSSLVEYPLECQVRRELILKSITFDYNKIVVVKSSSCLCTGDIIYSILSEYSGIIDVEDRWFISDEGVRMWRGALVKFENISDAARFTVELKKKFKNIRTAMLATVIRQVADFETLYIFDKENSSKITITRKGLLQVDDVKTLYQRLHTYGAITHLLVNNDPKQVNASCEVNYVFVTHAYLAMIMTNGLWFSEDVLSCAIDENQKEKRILHNAKAYVNLVLKSDFPC